MGRIITLSLAVLMTPVVVFLSPQARAQQGRGIDTLTGLANAGPQGGQPQAPGGAVSMLSQMKRLSGANRQLSRVNQSAQPAPLPATPAPGMQARPPVPQAALPAAQEHRQSAEPPDPGAYSPQLEARSLRIFGQGNVANEPRRQQWMADQEQQAIANEINRSKALLYPVSGR
jgi:hypothetical protein